VYNTKTSTLSSESGELEHIQIHYILYCHSKSLITLIPCFMDVTCSMRTVHKVQIHKVKPAAVQVQVY